VGLLRGAGNAIVPQVAAAFIEAYKEHERALVARLRTERAKLADKIGDK